MSRRSAPIVRWPRAGPERAANRRQHGLFRPWRQGVRLTRSAWPPRCSAGRTPDGAAAGWRRGWRGRSGGLRPDGGWPEEVSGTVGRSRPDLPRTVFLGLLRRTPGGMTVAVLRYGRSLGRLAPPRPSGRRHRRPGLPIWAAPGQRCVTPPSRGHRSPPARATLRITPLVDGNGEVIDLYSSFVTAMLDLAYPTRRHDMSPASWRAFGPCCR